MKALDRKPLTPLTASKVETNFNNFPSPSWKVPPSCAVPDCAFLVAFVYCCKSDSRSLILESSLPPAAPVCCKSAAILEPPVKLENMFPKLWKRPMMN